VSVYLSADGGEPEFLASNTGWGDVCRLVDDLDGEEYPALVHLREHGWWEPASELVHELAGLPKPKDKNIVAVLDTLNELAAGAGKESAITINTGMGPDTEA